MGKAACSTQKRWRKAGKFLLLFVLLYALLSMAASAVLFRILFRRQPEAPLSFSYAYADVAADYPRTEIGFSSCGRHLRGYVYAPRSAPLGLIVVANGVGSGADRHLAEIMYFVDQGWEVLTYDGTGIGGSEGDSIVGLAQMRLDLLAALSYAEESIPLPVVVYGHSAGGYAAASAVDRTPLAAAVCVCGFNSPVDTMYYKAKEYVGVLASLQFPFLRLQEWFTFGADGDVSAVECINRSETPVSVYFGEDDDVVPYEISLYAQKERTTNPNAVFHRRKDGHSTAWLSEGAEAYLAVLQKEYDELKEAYGGEVPPDALAAFRGGIDYAKANELDLSFMQEVVRFFASAVRNEK